MPQRLFGRPDRPTGDISDPDADLIFPEGTPKKSRKRKLGSRYAPESIEHLPEVSRGPTDPLMLPITPETRQASMPNTLTNISRPNGVSPIPQSILNNFPVHSARSANEQSETVDDMGLFGGPVSLS